MIHISKTSLHYARAYLGRVGGVLLAGLILLGGSRVEAQTPSATIKNENGVTRLQSFYDGGLLAPGSYGPTSPADSIPTEGGGTRLMWYPAKAAFRAGRVGRFKDGTQWDAAKVGDYSAAFGLDTEASNFASTAMGDGTIASGSIATAMGFGTEASGEQATAMGEFTIAATDNSLSIGASNSANTSADNTLFVVGNGSLNSRSDALVLDDQGNLTVSSQNTFSDRRLKTNIEPLGGSTLKKLGALRPVRYQFKNQQTHPSGEQIGLIAQDVRREFPSLVRKGPDGTLSLAYPKMTAVLLKGLQEQQTALDAKAESIAALKAENEEIKRRLAALEAERSSSVIAGLTGSSTSLLLALLLGGILGAGLFWSRRSM